MDTKRLSSPSTSRHSTAGRRFTHACYLIFFVSGAAALLYEISWSRQIGLLFGHTVQAGAVVLACYFGGMAAGYLVGARLPARLPPLLNYAVAEFAVAFWALIIPVLLSWAETPTVVNWLSSSSIAWQVGVRTCFSMLILLPGTVALGVTLPTMARAISRQNDEGMDDTTTAKRVTLAYAFNTAGAVGRRINARRWILDHAP